MRKTSKRAISTSIRSSIRPRAKALTQSAEQLIREVRVFVLRQSVLGELDNILSASATNPEPGQQDVLFDALIGEMQDLLDQQQAAATSQSKCWNDFANNTEGIREFLKEKRQRHETLTQQDIQTIARDLGGALAAYNKCMLFPRPKRVDKL